MKRLFASVVAAAVALGLAGSASAASVSVTSTDLDTLVLGDLIASSHDTFTTQDDVDIADLWNDVYFNDITSLWTYVHTVTPFVDNISELNTAFNVVGFTNGGATTAGYSFTDTGAAGGAGDGTDFDIEQDDDGTLDWAATFDWDTGETIAFHFQSIFGPTTGDYNLINADTGRGTSFAPVPEPSSLALLGMGALGMLGYARRRRQQA